MNVKLNVKLTISRLTAIQKLPGQKYKQVVDSRKLWSYNDESDSMIQQEANPMTILKAHGMGFFCIILSDSSS